MSVGTLPPQKGALSSTGTRLGSWLLPALHSTVGMKYLVAITGSLLTGFVVTHLAGNLLIFQGPAAINLYAQKLKDLGPLLWVARIGLLAIFATHLVLTLKLTLRNKAARPERYRYQNTVQATLASRTMILSGLVILTFVIFHLLHFTLHAIAPLPASQAIDHYTKDGIAGFERHHVYNMVIHGFQNVGISLAYIVAQVFFWLHLSHGVSSVFQTLGLNSPRFWPTLRGLGYLVATVLAAGNIAIPLSVLLGFLKFSA